MAVVKSFSQSVQLRLTLCNPTDSSTPGFPVYHQLPEPTQTYVNCIGNTIQPSLPINNYFWCKHIKFTNHQFSSVQFSRWVVSDSLRPHESQHARPPCPSPTPAVHSDSCPSSQWCQPTISSSVVPFSSCPNPSQHQSLFQWVNSSHEVAKVLEFQL